MLFILLTFLFFYNHIFLFSLFSDVIKNNNVTFWFILLFHQFLNHIANTLIYKSICGILRRSYNICTMQM